MAEAWMVRGYMLTSERLYFDAARRVENSPRLRKYKHIIMSDGYADDEDHLRWVIKGKVGEIEAWAKQIAEDCE
jgi:hypothetical protein